MYLSIGIIPLKKENNYVDNNILMRNMKKRFSSFQKKVEKIFL
jgi:hypothetical protein